MTIADITTLIGAIIAALNAVSLGYMAWKRLKPELKKADVDTDTGLIEASNLNLEGAKISAQILLDRINELKQENEQETNELKEELAMERKARKEDLDAERKSTDAKLATERKAREDDARYFKRRIKELEKDVREYRSWAGQLSKQVIEAGRIPVPFVSRITESSPGEIPAIRPELEGNGDDDLNKGEK